MSGFRYISFASIIALVYTGIVLLAELPAYITQNYDNAFVSPANWDMNFFTGASITFFAYTCHV
jgi:amino acid permease